jgi:antirestriction protein ArdC
MNTDQAKQLSETALNSLMAALEQGQSAALKRYLAVMSRFRKYSWANVLLIYTQFPQATHVGGFHFWLKLGRHVRKGEKGIAILAPMVGRKRGSEDEQPSEDERTRVFGFKACHVWDVSQTDGAESTELSHAAGPVRCQPEHRARLRRRNRARAGHVIRRQDHFTSGSFAG